MYEILQQLMKKLDNPDHINEVSTIHNKMAATYGQSNLLSGLFGFTGNESDSVQVLLNKILGKFVSGDNTNVGDKSVDQPKSINTWLSPFGDNITRADILNIDGMLSELIGSSVIQTNLNKLQ